MPETHTIQVIARIKSDFSEKFGIPRQSGLVQDCKALVVFEPEFRNPDALRGLEDFSHIWLIWQFSQAVRPDWSPTVRPPRLGGNKRLGVFATRSPFRPNALGLSAVGLEAVEQDPVLGPVLHVAGADLLDGTPIYDIKPYIPYADSLPEAAGGFTDRVERVMLAVDCPPSWSRSPRKNGLPFWASSPRTHAPPTRRTRTGSTVCPLPAWRFVSPWTAEGWS